LDCENGESGFIGLLPEEKMKTELLPIRDFTSNQRAFTFVEVVIATAITLVMFISFYAAMSSGVETIRVARENLRATQIIVSRMEGIRLFRWDQLTNTTLLPANFTENFYPNGNQGITYTGAVSVAAAALASPASSYSSNMYQITIQLNWHSFGPLRTRQMSTYCSQYGVQNYVWSSN
jgi:hypothetical protein